MPWWGWVVVGAVLLGSELLVATDFWLALLGAAALATGAAVWLGASEPAWLSFALYGVFAVLSVAVGRRLLGARRPAGDPPRADDALVGERGVVEVAMEPGAPGRVELRGTLWSARNAGDVPLERGARAQVVRVEGLTLHVVRAS